MLKGTMYISRKGLAVAVIILFLSLAVAPSINANAVDSELIEIEVELSGSGRKYTVKLTQQEVDEIELLFDDIEQRVSMVESREEANEIFREAIVQLDAYGLLGDLSVKRAQQLVIGNELRQRVLERMDEKYKDVTDDSANYLCLIGGKLDNIAIQGTISKLTIFGYSLMLVSLDWLINWASEHDFQKILDIIDRVPLFSIELLFEFLIGVNFISSTIFGYAIPVLTGKTITAGYIVQYPPYGTIYASSNGNVLSFGASGVKFWHGNLWGNASENIPIDVFYFYPALLGFTGIKLTILDMNFTTYFLGFALKASFSNERPSEIIL